MNRNKILFIDTSLSGLSGDMFLSALIDMGFEEKNLQEVYSIIKKSYNHQVFKGFKLTSTIRNGLQAKILSTEISEQYHGVEIEVFKEIFYKSLEKTGLREAYKNYASKVVEDLINAEKKIHQQDNGESIYLHELASPDTIFDIIGVSAGLQYFSILEEAEVYATPIPVGGGSVKISHGILRVPVPIVTELLRKYSIPFNLGPVEGELLTPTGIVLIANLKPIFQTIPDYLTILCEGYGAGNRLIKNFPNVLRLILFNKIGGSIHFLENDYVILLETNLDDITGERLSYAIEKIMETGALDVTAIPCLMKKGRSGYILKVLCTLEDEEKITSAVFNYTNTIGLRRSILFRYKLRREMETLKVNIKGELFEIRVKEVYTAHGSKRYKPEFDDVKYISEKLNLPLDDVLRFVNEAVEIKFKKI